MGMLGLSKDKHNVAGLGAVKFLLLFLAYFGRRNCNETHKIKIKWSMTKPFNRNLKGDKVLEE